jgi:glycosyltransferase involved in cell wall biosynthesis
MHTSVVIPLYNKASHIARALDSVLAQTTSDFEVIVVDDGSTDRGADIVRSYSNSRVKLVAQANSGVSAARNRGVAEAKTDLVAFLDADDEWAPDFLKVILSLRKTFPTATAWATAFALVGHDGLVRQPSFHGRLPSGGTPDLIDFFGGKTGYSPLHSSAISVEKKALLAIGGFPEGIVYGEDHDTWIRLALRYKIAWARQAKALIHLDAENRTDQTGYFGNYPFFDSVRSHFQKYGDGGPIPLPVLQYLARRHTALLQANWLAGETETMRTICRDCGSIEGYRFSCAMWSLAARIPHPLVLRYWRLRWAIRNNVKRKNDLLPVYRNIYRALHVPPSPHTPIEQGLAS